MSVESRTSIESRGNTATTSDRIYRLIAFG